jgi:uncharacterized protein YjdB
MTVGEKKTPTYTVEPEGATDKTVTWSSSDGQTATVGTTGEITALKEGTTTITSTNGKTATCEVTVVDIPQPPAQMCMPPELPTHSHRRCVPTVRSPSTGMGIA